MSYGSMGADTVTVKYVSCTWLFTCLGEVDWDLKSMYVTITTEIMVMRMTLTGGTCN